MEANCGYPGKGTGRNLLAYNFVGKRMALLVFLAPLPMNIEAINQANNNDNSYTDDFSGSIE